MLGVPRPPSTLPPGLWWDPCETLSLRPSWVSRRHLHSLHLYVALRCPLGNDFGFALTTLVTFTRHRGKATATKGLVHRPVGMLL